MPVMPLKAQEDVPTVTVERKNTGAGTTSAEFLLMGAGARGMALGPAYGAITRDVESLYYNPAALSLMPGMQAGVTVMPYFADTRYIWAGIATPISGGEYGIGISLANFGFGSAPQYTESDQNNTGQLSYSVNETVLGLSFAHSFIDRFSGGVTAKVISDHLGQTSGTAVAFDIGTNYHAELGGKPISMAFVIQNLGTSIKQSGQGLSFNSTPNSGDETFPSQSLDPEAATFTAQSSTLPVVFRVGAAYDALSMTSSRLTIMGEFNEQYNSSASFGFGSEFAWHPEKSAISGALRGSYAYQPDNNLSGQETTDFAGSTDLSNKEKMDGLTLGAGLGWNVSENYNLKADYAWKNFGVLGAKNVFTLSIGWR
jgi:opacity protein-like surface antigen